MILLRLWNFFRGYVIINVNGYFIEKFINLCANKGIYLWNIKRKKSNNMTLNISIRGFKQLRGITKKTKCNVNIIRKVGLPFIKFRYRNRKTFVAGFITFIMLIYILSSFIWVIEIQGIKSANPQVVVDFLAKNGIKPGVIKFKIDKDILIPTMLIEIEEISWAEISLSGTKAILKIVERLPKQEVIDRKTPCNIYASKNGVIKSIITKNGSAKVREGDVIRKGDLLISGIIDNKLYPDNFRIVHSDGEVNAITWYQDEISVNIVQIKRERTAEYKYGLGFRVFSNHFNLFRKQSPYKLYDIEEKTNRISFWKNFELPIEVIAKKYYKVDYNKYIYTEEEVKEQAKNLVFSKLDKIIPEGTIVIDKKIEYTTIGDNIIKALATYECNEDIGYKQIIIDK